MLEYAVNFYDILFGEEQRSGVKLDEDFWEEEEKVTQAENDILEAKITEEEIKEAIFGSYVEGAAGPDGFSFLFYQKFWEIIKADFMALVREFEKGKLNVSRLNYAIITLIPKEPEAKNLKKFRPISLINCSFKIFSKAMNNRLVKICDRLLANNQSAFIEGRYILESVVTAHEIIHETVKIKKQGLILKLDYEKAYDRVNWGFLMETLESRGFSKKWIS